MKRNFFGCFFLMMAVTGWLLLAGCASTARFNGKGDFCGLIVDEENRPVENFFVQLWNNGLPSGSAVTNGSGIFVVENVPAGSYRIYGKKRNYERLDDRNVDFFSRGKFFCFQTRSAECVFDAVDGLIGTERFSEAKDLLERLEIEKQSVCETVWLCYMAYVCRLTGNGKGEKQFVGRILKNRKIECGEFIEKLGLAGKAGAADGDGSGDCGAYGAGDDADSEGEIAVDADSKADVDDDADGKN